MSEEEKKLCDLLNKRLFDIPDITQRQLKDALLEAFPQITKKPLPMKLIGHQHPDDKIVFVELIKPDSIENGEACFLKNDFIEFKETYYVEVINE